MVLHCPDDTSPLLLARAHLSSNCCCIWWPEVRVVYSSVGAPLEREVLVLTEVLLGCEFLAATRLRLG